MTDSAGWKGGRPADNTGLQWLINRLNKMQADLNELRGAAQLRAAGIHATEEGLRVDSSLGVAGDLDVTGAATFSGDTEIGGNAAITGTLSLPAGIIDNDALASPVSFAEGDGSNDGFSVPQGPGEFNIASMQLTVPAGYTGALVVVIGTIYALNSTATMSYLRSRVYVDHPTQGSTWGRQLLAPLPNSNGSAVLTVNHQHRYADLVGGQVITARIIAVADYVTIPAAPSNGATVCAFAIFTR
ncbi:MAG: hypothetical protein ACYC1Z_03360 [Georgenia sp.]